MSDEFHVIDLLPAYALGSLKDEESALIAQHLRDCPACQLELSACESVVSQLALAVTEAAPQTL